MTDALAELRSRLAEIHDLNKAAAVIAWDQRTVMPPGGAAARAEQLATLRRVAHAALGGAEIERLLDAVAPLEPELAEDSVEAALIRVARRDHQNARCVPSELRADMARAGSLAQEAWVQARERSDFGRFLPFLERNLELAQRFSDCFPSAVTPYDPLLEQFEEGASSREVRALFRRLRDGLRPLVAEVAAQDHWRSPVRLPSGPFPVAEQQPLVVDLLRRVGFDPATWRVDTAVHPFATSSSRRDVRVTVRYRQDDPTQGLLTALHEFGHGLYEHGVDPAFDRTPMARGVSLGVHESQSLLWENVVGRSQAFWRFFAPSLQAAFPAQLGQLDGDAVFRAVNRVEPSLIRVNADAVTYGLHVIMRFELEQELVDGRLAPRDLPEAWSAHMEADLGLEVPNDACGVLQDIHWAKGLFGYFPTYGLGTIASAQFWERALEDLPDLEQGFERGEFGPLREWLHEHVHRHGRSRLPQETLARVVGGPPDPEPLLRLLRARVADAYGIELGPGRASTPLDPAVAVSSE